MSRYKNGRALEMAVKEAARKSSTDTNVAKREGVDEVIELVRTAGGASLVS